MRDAVIVAAVLLSGVLYGRWDSEHWLFWSARPRWWWHLWAHRVAGARLRAWCQFCSDARNVAGCAHDGHRAYSASPVSGTPLTRYECRCGQVRYFTAPVTLNGTDAIAVYGTAQQWRDEVMTDA